MAKTSGLSLSVTTEERRLINWLSKDLMAKRKPAIMQAVRDKVVERGGRPDIIMADARLDAN